MSVSRCLYSFGVVNDIQTNFHAKNKPIVNGIATKDDSRDESNGTLNGTTAHNTDLDETDDQLD